MLLKEGPLNTRKDFQVIIKMRILRDTRYGHLQLEKNNTSLTYIYFIFGQNYKKFVVLIKLL